MGRQGECSREKAKDVILLFAADQKKHTRSEFIEELVTKRKEFAKNTVYKYLDELVTDELMKMEPGSREDSFRPVYSITKLGLEKVDRIESHNFIDSFETKWLSAIKSMLSGLLSKFKKVGWNADRFMETQGFMVIPTKRPPRPGARPAIFQNLVFFPLEEKALLDVVKYLKEEQWIH